MANRIFTNASDMSQWIHGTSISHQYDWIFTGRIEFQIHPACDALYHIKNATTTNPFKMKSAKDNIWFLEHTSPSSITFPAENSCYSDHKKIVYGSWKWIMLVSSQAIILSLSYPNQAIYVPLLSIIKLMWIKWCWC